MVFEKIRERLVAMGYSGDMTTAEYRIRMASGEKIAVFYGAGAVVTKDVPPRTIVGGVPAKVIKTI